MSQYYYALWIPVLQKTSFTIIGHPQTKILRDSKEFSHYTIKGKMEKDTLHFTLIYREGKGKEKQLQFKCISRCSAGILIYCLELEDNAKDSLEEKLQSKMPTFIYHYIKDYFHKHIHHHPSHDSLLQAYFSEQPLSLKNAADKAKIMEHYIGMYLQKFKAHSYNAQNIFIIAKQDINSRFSINKGIKKLEFILNEGREILGEAEFCCALITMEAVSIAKESRKSIFEEKQTIEKLQQQISFSYNLCTSSYGIKLGYWGIWFGVIGIFVSAVSFIYSICITPDYSPIINKIDSMRQENNIKVESFMKTERSINSKLDSINHKLKNINNKKNTSSSKNKK